MPITRIGTEKLSPACRPSTTVEFPRRRHLVLARSCARSSSRGPTSTSAFPGNAVDAGIAPDRPRSNLIFARQGTCKSTWRAQMAREGRFALALGLRGLFGRVRKELERSDPYQATGVSELSSYRLDGDVVARRFGQFDERAGNGQP